MILIAIVFTLSQMVAFLFATWLYEIHEILAWIFVFAVACCNNALFDFIYKYGKSEGRKELKGW